MYFLLDGWRAPRRWIDGFPQQAGVYWNRGIRHEQAVAEPLEVTLEPFDEDEYDEDDPDSEAGPDLPPLFDLSTALVIRDDLLDVLKAAGADNLQICSVALRDPDTEECFTNYKAVNIIGEFPRATLGRPSEEFLVEASESISSEAASGPQDLPPIFRVKDAIGIFVTEAVKDRMIAAGFDKLHFIAPQDAAM